jgi:isopenicillin-N N-acyltransferase-like protein
MEIAHVEMRGTPHEMGLQHGDQCAALIRDVVAHYGRYQAAGEEVRAAIQSIRATLEAEHAPLLEEMQGIAAGAELPFEDILNLNTVFDAKGDISSPGPRCTAIGLPQTPDGPLVAKTDDVGLDERAYEVCVRGQPDQGRNFICYAFAGSVWNQGGINEAGLAVAMTGLQPAGEAYFGGVPSLIFLRQLLLQCDTVDEALAYVHRHPLRIYGCSITLADPNDDQVTVVEDYPALRATRTSRTQPIVHTNHPIWPETQALAPNQRWQELYSDSEFAENSQSRFENARRLVGQIPHTIAGLKELLGNHADRGAICQHGQADLHTSVAMIMVPRRRAMIAAEGYGCDPYVEYTL